MSESHHAEALSAEARHLAEMLEHRALHDALTGLPNRALFHDRLGQALLIAERERTIFALLFLDLDGFKAVNDRLGHHAGDLLLQQVAARLRGTLRESDTVARLYGDEFAVLLPGDDAAAAEGVAHKLLGALATPCLIYGQPEYVEVSIGIALFPAHGSDPDALLRRADAAMYVAKRARSKYATAGFVEEQQRPHFIGHEPDRAAAAAARPTAAGSAPSSTDLQAANEHLLLAGLREQELADQLRHQLAFTNAIVGNLGEGVCALDRAGRITFVNPVAARLLGWPEADLLGRDWDETVHGRHTTDSPSLEAMRSGTIRRTDNDLFARRDGGTFAAAYTAAPIGGAGAAGGAVVVFRDITAQRRAEEERTALLAQVKAALAFRTRFLAITMHELKSPLTLLKGYTTLLLRRARQGDDDRLVGSLTTIGYQADRMARLVQDLGDVAQIESGGLTLDSHPLDLRALLAETVAEVRLATPDFALHLQDEGTETGAVWVRGDRPRLQQVLTNLLANAVKYSAQRREASIALWRDGDRAMISVVDYGIGIPAAQRADVFEPYVRASNALAATSGGLGLGLFISKAIVERHGGMLTLVSQEGQGSTFSLSLPLPSPQDITPGR